MKYLLEWGQALSTTALCMELLLLAGTIFLVRSAMHPTTFALLAWPGTVAHELAHAAIGFILGAKPCDFSLSPKAMPNGSWQLGSVSFANFHWWSAPPTAMAPLLLAPLSVGLAAEWVAPVWDSGEPLGALWRLGFCTLLLQASWPSSTDFRVAAPGLVILGGLLIWLG